MPRSDSPYRLQTLGELIAEAAFPIFGIAPSQHCGPTWMEWTTVAQGDDRLPVLSSVRLHYLDRLEEPSSGFVVSTWLAAALPAVAPARPARALRTFGYHLANFVAWFDADLVRRRLVAGRSLFEEGDVSPALTVLDVSLMAKRHTCTLYEHVRYPLQFAEASLGTEPPVRMCLAGWGIGISVFLPFLQQVGHEFAREFDKRRSSPDRQ